MKNIMHSGKKFKFRFFQYNVLNFIQTNIIEIIIILVKYIKTLANYDIVIR